MFHRPNGVQHDEQAEEHITMLNYGIDLNYIKKKKNIDVNAFYSSGKKFAADAASKAH